MHVDSSKHFVSENLKMKKEFLALKTHMTPGSVVRSSMHPCLGNWVAIERALMYFAQAAHTFSTGIKCRHCTGDTLVSAIVTGMVKVKLTVQYLIQFGLK